MAQVTDFDKLRKKRRRGVLMKRFLILSLIAVGVVGVLSINNFLLEVGILTRLSDFVQGFGGSGYPVPVPGGILRDVKSLGSDLCVLNDTNLHVYNSKGKQLGALQRAKDSTVMEIGGGRILTYDLGDTRYAIHSKSKLLLEGQTEYGLMGGTINARGDYALISASKQYMSDVTVCDSRGEQMFQWKSSELVAGVSISPSGKKMAACSVGANGGMLISAVMLFEFTKDTELARAEFPDELVLWVDYRDSGSVGVLTDRQYRILSESGSVIFQQDFGGARLVSSCLLDGMVLLLTESTETRTQTVTLFDKGGEELGKVISEKTVRDMRIGGREVYMLTDEGINIYDQKLSLQRTVPMTGVNRIQFAGDKLYYFTSEEICRLNG